MDAISKYGIEVGQLYSRADGSDGHVEVIDTTTYANVDDVVVKDLDRDYVFRIDAFKLAMVRYSFTGYYTETRQADSV